MAIIQIDTDEPVRELTPASPDAAIIRRMVAQYIRTLQAVHGGTPDEAIAAAADAARPDASGVVGTPLRIRAREAELIRTGGFPVGNPVRWLPGGEAMKRYLFGLANSPTAAADIAAAPPIRALDGTNFAITTVARLTTISNALGRQERLITQAANAAIQAYRAATTAEPPQPFDFDAIAWPAVYAPPAPVEPPAPAP